MNRTGITQRASYRRKPVSSLIIDWSNKMDSGLRGNDVRGRRHSSIVVVVLLLTLLVACSKDQAQPDPKPNVGDATAITDRIAVPSSVRDNLGITFVKAEYRDVANTIRLAGAFELPPQARHEYRLPYAGRVDVLIKQYQAVKAGDELFRLDSPDWRATIEELGSAKARLDLASANVTMQQQLIAAAKSKVDGIPTLLDVHKKRVAALTEAETVWAERVRTLEDLQGAGGGRASELASAKGELAAARSNLAEAKVNLAGFEFQRIELEADLKNLEAGLPSAEAESTAAQLGFDLMLASVASTTGISTADLTANTTGNTPRWATLGTLTMRAASAGVVDALNIASGAWLEAGELVMATVDTTALRFRARAAQSDLGRLADGLNTRIVPPRGGTLGIADTMAGKLALAPTADADSRLIDALVTPDALRPWAKAGVAAFLEVTVSGGTQEVAIPEAAIIRDGLEDIYFQRDPANPDNVIRRAGDFGVRDGQWVQVLSGLAEGDEVALTGVYELMLTGSGKAPKGGHFHADGTFHEGDHDH